MSSCTQRLNTETVRQLLTQYPRSEFRLPSWHTDLPKGTIDWLEEPTALRDLIHFKRVDANALEGSNLSESSITHSKASSSKQKAPYSSVPSKCTGSVEGPCSRQSRSFHDPTT